MTLHQQIYQALSAQKYCYCDKTTAIEPIVQRLEDDGCDCAYIDLATIDSQSSSEQFYLKLIQTICSSLDLTNTLQPTQWWQDLDYISPVQRMDEFFGEILLNKTQHIVIIITNWTTLHCSSDGFLRIIRCCYEQRNTNPNYQRLSFGLLGCNPTKLMKDKNSTPFNVGQHIQH